MQCPNGDGELSAHTTSGENNLAVSYSTCPTCHGYWMESFAANFIKLPPFLATTVAIDNKSTNCPICQKMLVRATGNNIPDSVTVFKCPDDHGYFFPEGQLSLFKEAQHAKISYFKLWHIPMPSVASVLLSVFVAVILAGGGYFAFTAVGTRQNTQSQAQNILIAHNTFVTPDVSSILFSATTGAKAIVTLHIPAMDNLATPMDTEDGLTHIILVRPVAVGPHTYYFTIEQNGKTTQSDTFDVTMPSR